jgi:hypothetical protein
MPHELRSWTSGIEGGEPFPRFFVSTAQSAGA